LLLCSYIFYGWWDWRFVILLFSISAFNYFIAIQIQTAGHKLPRRILLIVALTVNVGTLIIFKYFNFFIDGIINLGLHLGFKINIHTLNIILPIGISFYIFLSISYLVDVYKSKLSSERNLVTTLLSLSFFPIILAGPIHRPIGLIPQIKSPRIFNYNIAVDGLKQILWGVFMKIVIADLCAGDTTEIFRNPSIYMGSTLIIGLFLFTIQIYADFAGYSNIAIGLGKLLGFNIMKNFDYPYFAQNIKEFWRRWNISLTTWFRDYFFLPVAFYISRNIKSDKVYYIKTEFFIYTIGIILTWVLTGLWHGANYTFIFWGLLQGIFLIINHIIAKPRKKLLKKIHISSHNNMLIFIDSILTFIIIMFSWIFFKVSDLEHAISYISTIFSASSFSKPEIIPKISLPLIALFIIFEWLGRKHEYAIAKIGNNWPKPIRWVFYYCIFFMIFVLAGKEQQFIYFSF
jgi:D-alanyl-lipoteichoic acid acyltransferase DltB (MBOAT superfamily)